MAVALAAMAAAAAAPPAGAPPWSRLAADDVEAAYRLLRDSHPGAARELHDHDFVRTLADAHRQARAVARRVRDAGDHAATLRLFAAAFHDGHIAWRPPAVAGRPGDAEPQGGAPDPSRHPDLVVTDTVVRIVLPRLDAAAAAIVAAAAVRRAAIARNAKVVIDLRGNDGGNSDIGDQLIALLYGDAAARLPAVAAPRCPVAWRASPGNVDMLRRYAARAREATDPRAAAIEREAQWLAVALHDGRSFAVTIPEACLGRDKPDPPRPAATTRIQVVTDGRCFSSCLLLVEKLRALGATQTGSPTAAGNWYMEVRWIALPSGRGSFSTLQKVDLRRSMALGPFVPDDPSPPAIPTIAAAGRRG